ncbi:MAG: endospore germination permease [Oscillospiraceae bacterium]|nr:endospore germination permease [Oscillospiraceae bacterium]
MSKLNYKNAIAIVLVFYIGSHMVHTPEGLGTDGWAAHLIGFVAVTPLLLILARLVQLMPRMDLFEMLEYALGRSIAIIVSLLYFLYFTVSSASVGAYYGSFLQLTSLPNTPFFVLLLALFGLCAYLAKSGGLTLGKWSVILGAVTVFTAVLLTLFAIPSMRAENLLPVVENGGRAIARAGARQAVFPFGEAIVFLALFGRLDQTGKSYKVFFLGAIFAAGVFILNFLRDAAILGAGGMDSLRYPFFEAAGVIRVGALETRIETLVTLPIVIAGLTTAAIYLFAATGAVRRVFGVKDSRALYLWLTLSAVGLAMVLFGNMRMLPSFSAVHFIVAPLFQLGFPVLIWLVAEVKSIRRPVIAEEKKSEA